MDRQGFTVLVAILTAACGSPTAPDYTITDARPMDPPAWFAQVHAEVHECVAPTESRPFEAVEWFVAEALATPDAPVVAGMTIQPGTIYLAEPWVDDPRVVRHELVHYVMASGNEIHGSPEMARCAPWWGTEG